MDATDRKSLAQQIENNPLFLDIMVKLERDAIEEMVRAKDDTSRLEGQCAVKAARTYRRNFLAELRNKPERKGAPV